MIRKCKIRKITIDKFTWTLITLFVLIIGILDILDIDHYSRAGTVKADFERGLWIIPIAIIVLIIIHKLFKNKVDKVYICEKCEEAYSENNYKENNICIKCNGKLVDLNGFYENNPNKKKLLSKKILKN